MEGNAFKQVADRGPIHLFASILALVIGLVLFIAAYGKFFHPAEGLKILEKWVSGFEILLAGIIFLLRKRWQMWLGAGLIFASWCGYSVFWCCLQLPCSCMGSMVKLPTAFSITLDILFFCASLSMGYFLGAARRYVYFFMLSGLFMMLVGFAFGEWVYQTFILQVRLGTG